VSPHCRISRVKFKGSDRWWILPRPEPAMPLPGDVFCTMTMGATRIGDGVIEVDVRP
jgi:hypothetical protein